MTPQKRTKKRRLSRFVLPLMCVGLAGASAAWGEFVLVEYAGKPTLGPLVAAQIAAMATVGFAVLGVILFLLALFPGREPLAEPEFTDTAGLLDDIEEAVESDNATGTPAERGRSTEQVIDALKRSATKQATARIEAEKRAEAAEATTQQLQAELAAFRDGTAPEVDAIKAQVREDSDREAYRKIQELGESHDRLVNGLKDGKARVEADLAAKEAELAQTRDDLTSELTRTREELRDAQAQIPLARREGASDEHRRISIAVQAINDTEVDVLDHLQRDAVRRHADRVAAALKRLDPANEPDLGPNMAMPPMERPAATPPTPEPFAENEEPSKKKRSGGFRRTRRANS